MDSVPSNMASLKEEVLDKTSDSEAVKAADEGMSSMATHFLVVGILCLATVIMGLIYFFLQYGGLDTCRRHVMGMGYSGPERVTGSSGQGGGGGGRGGGRAGIKIKAQLKN